MTEHRDALTHLLALAETLGVTADELAAAAASPLSANGRTVPTVAEFLPAVEAATTEGARKTYATYWQRLAETYGDRRVDDISSTDLKALVRSVQSAAVKRANARGGVGAAENCVAAMRAFWACAVADGFVKEDPTTPERLPKPKRPASRRRALTDDEISALWEITVSGGDDPTLDALLFRLHLESGCRRGGALALRLRDIDTNRQLIRLREKGGTERWQPVSRPLIVALVEHAHQRGAKELDDPVLRYRPQGRTHIGRPLTRKRYNTLVDRWRESLPWADELGVSIHWVRHTAITTVERIAGFGVARAFAGHRTSAETTTTYITATLSEVAAAVAAMTGEPHPLAPDDTSAD